MSRLFPPKIAERWSRLQARFTPDYVAQADPLTQWRERVLLNVVLLAVILGPFALVPSLFLAIHEGRWDVVVIDCLSYGVALGILAVFRSSPLPLRAWATCLLLFVLGLGLLFMLGPTGAGYIWLFAASVMAGGFISLAAGAWSLLLNLAAMLAVALAIHQGWTHWPIGSENLMKQWLVVAINFMLLNTLVTITTSLMLTGLKRSLLGEQEVSASLRESEARFRGLADNAPDVIFTLDKSGAFTYANPAVRRALGLPPEDLAGKLLADFAAPGQRDSLRQNLDAIMNAEPARPALGATLRHADGRSLEFLLSGAPNHDREGKLLGMVGLLKDVTEQRLLTRQLQHSQKMEAVGTLAGGMAHDFNNLLGAVIGYTELAQERLETGLEPGDELHQILQAAERAADLVKRILTFSRKVEPDLRPLDLNQEVNLAVRMLGRTIPKMINIVTRPGRDLPPIMADASQISQMLMNLGTNARDAMPEGGTLTLETEQVELAEDFCRTNPGCRPGPHVRLSVSDTGEGMDRATQEHIFEPFFTRKEPGKGTGLGLAMVFGIVQGHGGCITCQSSPGQGARFDIFLPVRPETDPVAIAARADASDPPMGNGTVLVVDDEPALREVAGRVLELAGYRTVLAKSGEEALEKYRRQGGEIDLVVLDLNMPGMGGAACLKRLVSLDPEVKVIIASGYAGDAEGQKEINRLAAGYVQKPFRRKELLAAVARVLSPR